MKKLFLLFWFVTNVYIESPHAIRWHVEAVNETDAIVKIHNQIIKDYGKGTLWGFDKFEIEEMPTIEIYFYHEEKSCED